MQVNNKENKQGMKHLTISSLLKEDEYIVPIYQRNYAWGREEIELLINDIKTASEKETANNYYIGSLIVYKRENGKFEVIDGQQRLTTLHILAAACGIERKTNLSFEHRQESEKSLLYLSQDQTEYKTSIDLGLKDTKIILIALFGDDYLNSDLFKRFRNFLEKNVIILRTEVPPETDLNHYFEIMNNRGEQLEKHEVLKAKLMSRLSEEAESSALFAMIWDACSDMNRYAVMSFKLDIRKELFFNGEEAKRSLEEGSFGELLEKIKGKIAVDNTTQSEDKKGEESSDKNRSIYSIITEPLKLGKIESDDSYDRFGSVINFPNFLMHVLRIYLECSNANRDSISNISLDDKNLLDGFKVIHYGNEIDNIKKFAFILLKTRVLFDYYVIKTDSSKETESHWSLLTPKYRDNSLNYNNTFNDGVQNSIIMLLSMFHTSYPSRNYKNWLYAVLRGLVLKGWINSPSNYMQELEKLSDKFYFNVYHHNHEFFDVIYDEVEILQPNYDQVTEILHSGVNVNHFIFNRLDYLLWKNEKKKYDKFRFTFRSSVEHYYPQTPLDNIQELDQKTLHNFGNLCLVSREKNAKLSNHTPEAKKDYYKSNSYDSLKQQIMMSYESWTKKDIKKHSKQMVYILNKKSS